jgi:1-acyl-sn-glycerol-3-phosphate acyltransferase
LVACGRACGHENLVLDASAVLVENHASYVDVVVLLATLRATFGFAKARLATYPILGTLIRRTQSLEVKRGTSAAADDLVATLKNGESLFVFPEGTFIAHPGVLPFRLGAFHAAVDTSRPV